MKFLCFLLITIFLSACAAQDSYRQYERARALLEAAEKVDPLHSRLEHAQLALEAGYENLRGGQYTQASRRFRQVERVSEDILERGDFWAVEPDPVSSPEEMRRQARSSEARSEETEEEEVDVSRMELPAQALAQYLARKGAASTEPPTPSRPAAQPAPVPELEPEEDEVSNEPSASATVIRSGSSRQERPDPELEEEPVPQLSAAEEDPSSANRHRRRRVPEALEFAEAQANLSLEVMDRLDQMSVFLLDNPSQSLILEGVLGETEDAPVVRRRFDSIQTYLSAKGVPEDQVRLDEEQKSASSGKVQMYLIEH